MNRAVFLDRDGVINDRASLGEYITRWEEMKFLPSIADAIRLLKQNGFLVIVATNQRCVARGLIATEDLEVLHRKMCKELALGGALIDRVYYCPHDVDPPCDCRKPKPGMLLRAAQDYEIALSESWMVGDSGTDVEAGKRAGCRTVRIAQSELHSPNGADIVAPTLFDAVQQILSSI